MGLVNAFTTGARLALAASSVFSHVVAGARTNILRPASVVLPQGRINGFRDDSRNTVYLGVPFAATTGGENRCVNLCNASHYVFLTIPKVAGTSGCPGIKLNI